MLGIIVYPGLCCEDAGSYISACTMVCVVKMLVAILVSTCTMVCVVKMLGISVLWFVL